MVDKIRTDGIIRKNKTAYCILDAFLSVLLFIIVYKNYIEKMEYIMQLPFIFVGALLTSLMASIISRFITRYWKTTKTVQHAFKNIFIAFLYSFLVWIGIIAYLFEQFDLSTIDGMIRLAGVLFFIKLFVFFAADYYADKIAFNSE